MRLHIQYGAFTRVNAAQGQPHTGLYAVCARTCVVGISLTRIVEAAVVSWSWELRNPSNPTKYVFLFRKQTSHRAKAPELRIFYSKTCTYACTYAHVLHTMVGTGFMVGIQPKITTSRKDQLPQSDQKLG